jgi:hypothetical protein
MDRACLLALRQEAERCLESELKNRYPDLTRAFEVRLAAKAESAPDVSADYIDW